MIKTNDFPSRGILQSKLKECRQPQSSSSDSLKDYIAITIFIGIKKIPTRLTNNKKNTTVKQNSLQKTINDQSHPEKSKMSLASTNSHLIRTKETVHHDNNKVDHSKSGSPPLSNVTSDPNENKVDHSITGDFHSSDVTSDPDDNHV